MMHLVPARFNECRRRRLDSYELEEVPSIKARTLIF